jgi:predicted nucleic acid-binding protein
MTDSNKYFVDTNVLLYATFKNLGYYDIANKTLMQYSNLYISKQVIYEFINISLNRKILKSVNADKVNEYLNAFTTFTNLIDDAPLSLDEIFYHINTFKIYGRRIFDLKIYLDMKSNKISKIITRNEKDFKLYEDIEIINPFEKPEQ